MPTASQARPRSSRIPKWPQPRPWSTQYHDDYNKRRPGSRTGYRPRGHATRHGPSPQRQQDCIDRESLTQNARSHIHQEALAAAKTYLHEFGHEMGVHVDPDFVITGTQIALTQRGEPGDRSISAILRDMGIDSDTDENMEYMDTADDIPRAPTPEEVVDQSDAAKDPDSVPHTKTPPPDPQSHWSQWPDPGAPEKRPHTSIGFADLSKEKNKDRPLTPEPNSASGVNEYTDPGASMTYIPALRTWINANNDYRKYNLIKIRSLQYYVEIWQTPIKERAVVDKMLSSMNRERTFHHYQPSDGGKTPRDSYSYFNPRPTNPHATIPGYYSNHGYSYSRNLSRDDDGVIRGMAIKLGEREPLPSIYSKSMEGVPFNRRKKQLPKSDDYVHELSMFMTTQPRVTGHFIIHPDWVSERMGLRRSHTMFEPRKTSKEGLRYSSF